MIQPLSSRQCFTFAAHAIPSKRQERHKNFKREGKKPYFFSNVLIFHIITVQSLPPSAGLSGRLRSSVRKIMGKKLIFRGFRLKDC